MANVMDILPEIPPAEQAAIAAIVDGVPDERSQMFAMAYRAQRKDESTVLLLTLIGFIAIAGVQRFFLGQIGMGLLYVFTVGLCFIGTIIDIVNHRKLTDEYNVKIAAEIAMNMGSSSPYRTP